MTSDKQPDLWLEVIIKLPAEYADEAGGLLVEIGGNAVQELESNADEASFKTFIPDNKRSQTGLNYLNSWLSTRGAPQAEVSYTPDFDWVTEVRKNTKPVRIGNLMIAPTWSEPKLLSDDILIRLDPGRAFGTGHHETTSLCLELIMQAFKDTHPSPTFLDVGTGAGILAITAKKLGAAQAVGVDVDHTAVVVAIENASLNQVEASFLTSGPECIRGSFDIVAANILCSTIMNLSEDLARLVADDGILLLSGILENEMPDIEEKFRSLGFSRKTVINKDCWSAIRLEHTKHV